MIDQEHLELLKRRSDYAYNYFIQNLTNIQRYQYTVKLTVPKSKVHQKRYQAYVSAKEEFAIMKRRSQFRIVA